VAIQGSTQGSTQGSKVAHKAANKAGHKAAHSIIGRVGIIVQYSEKQYESVFFFSFWAKAGSRPKQGLYCLAKFQIPKATGKSTDLLDQTEAKCPAPWPLNPPVSPNPPIPHKKKMTGMNIVPYMVRYTIMTRETRLNRL
jgi:hypothetical protein